MKIALVGGTHGNEPVGIEVMKYFKETSETFENQFKCFWGNPKAYELKRRYVDFDLNRSFGKNTKTHGYEKQRAEELTKEIQGYFDFCIDLHTTTSNMGLTAILNNTHENTRKVCANLAKTFHGLKLIEEDVLDLECTHLNRLCPGGVTVEVGPVANNVVSGDLVLKTIEIVRSVLNFDFTNKIDLTNVPYYKMLGQINYPEYGSWYIHPLLENTDFTALPNKAPIFISAQGEEILWEEDEVYPFFVNEAAYIENKSAFLIARLAKGWD